MFKRPLRKKLNMFPSRKMRKKSDKKVRKKKIEKKPKIIPE
jgi:hypothetical protein